MTHLKSLFFILLFGVFALMNSMQVNDAKAGGLELTIMPKEASDGLIYIKIVKDNPNLPYMEALGDYRIIGNLSENNQFKLTLHNLPKGNYVAVWFIDENGNEALDTNLFGIPTEPYGFSNNPTGVGAPEFEAIAFLINDEGVTNVLSKE